MMYYMGVMSPFQFLKRYIRINPVYYIQKWNGKIPHWDRSKIVGRDKIDAITNKYMVAYFPGFVNCMGSFAF